MKFKRWLFLIIAITLIVAGIIHTALSYAAIAADQETGFPATVALLLLIPYAVCSALFFVGWVIVTKKIKKCNQ